MMGPFAGADYNLILCPPQSPLQHIHHGQPYARVDLKSLTLYQSRLYPPVRDFGFSLWDGMTDVRMPMRLPSYACVTCTKNFFSATPPPPPPPVGGGARWPDVVRWGGGGGGGWYC
jgi:hypothetical protein